MNPPFKPGDACRAASVSDKVAFTVRRFDRHMAIVTMVGDTHEHSVYHHEMKPLDASEYCAGCGQIGAVRCYGY